jgi:hypothetical protein
MNEEDYFDKQLQMSITKPALKKMLDAGEINSVERDYTDDTGFNRMK